MIKINTAAPIPSGEEAKGLNRDYPGLLLENEVVDIGFKAIRDEFYFTSHRILIIDKMGFTGRKIEYKSCPYHSIKAFSVQTAGLLDTYSELKIYGAIMDLNIQH